MHNSKKDVQRLKAEKRSVELMHTQTIKETYQSLQEDMNAVNQEV